MLALRVGAQNNENYQRVCSKENVSETSVIILYLSTCQESAGALQRERRQLGAQSVHGVDSLRLCGTELSDRRVDEARARSALSCGGSPLQRATGLEQTRNRFQLEWVQVCREEQHKDYVLLTCVAGVYHKNFKPYKKLVCKLKSIMQLGSVLAEATLITGFEVAMVHSQ